MTTSSESACPRCGATDGVVFGPNGALVFCSNCASQTVASAKAETELNEKEKFERRIKLADIVLKVITAAGAAKSFISDDRKPQVPDLEFTPGQRERLKELSRSFEKSRIALEGMIKRQNARENEPEEPTAKP